MTAELATVDAMTRPRGWTKHLDIGVVVWIHNLELSGPNAYQRGSVCRLTRTWVVVNPSHGTHVLRFWNHRAHWGDNEGRSVGEDGTRYEIYPANDTNDLYAARLPDLHAAQEHLRLQRMVAAAADTCADDASLRSALRILTERTPHGRRRR